MLDIEFIRQHPEEVKNNVAKRGMDVDVPALLALDEKRRKKIKEVDDARAEHNKLSSAIQELSGDEREQNIAASRELKSKLQSAGAERTELEDAFYKQLMGMPNLLMDDVPDGEDESENVVVREVGQKRQFGFTPRDYMDIAAPLGLIDVERAAKVSGSRFGYLKRELVLLEMALVHFAFEKLAQKRFVPVSPPVLVGEEMMRGMGYIDSKEDRAERYFLEKDKLYLVGTAEQSLGPMHADEMLNEGDMPLRYAGFSTCFRREAGSYGKDTHGILRVHQFDKIEMFTFSSPKDAVGEHELMLAVQEELMQALKIPYRVVQLCAGDIARPSASTVDIEAWLPGQAEGAGEYRETHSTSNTTDFQSRRLNVRMRKKDGTLEFVHMLNGTAFAIGRTLIAILENYQNEDGSVEVPEVLRQHMGGMTMIGR